MLSSFEYFPQSVTHVRSYQDILMLMLRTKNSLGFHFSFFLVVRPNLIWLDGCLIWLETPDDCLLSLALPAIS